MLQYAAGVGFGHEQQQQPHRAFLPQRPGADVQIRFFQRQRRPLQLSVLGDVILQQMGDLLFHQAADQLAFIDDGNQLEAALVELGNDLRAFIVRFDAEQAAVHQVADRLPDIPFLQ